ncbi:hypothetical protein [Aestuariivirga sp.]|uniref:hypothetical protein n=1 Tax=Aestuariivirga sp. TaxID=2650926 RepID=UPI0035B09B87
MKAGRGMLGELCFAAEGLSGTAASSSLRKLGSIMETAPSGRLFGAISTLSDMSAKAARALEEGTQDIGRNDENAAARLGEALLHMDGLAEMSEGGHIPVPEKRRAVR